MDKRPKLLVLEFWGLGDVALSVPFLRAASERWDVTLLAKSHASQLQSLIPAVKVIEFSAPWTAFRGKYRLWNWPWGQLRGIISQLRAGKFECAVSARWDPRDHVLMSLSGASRRVGFPRLGSGLFLTDGLPAPGPSTHRYECWRRIGQIIGVELPPLREAKSTAPILRTGPVIIHSGAAQPTRIWPIERFRAIAQRLRAEGSQVQILCDATQQNQWQQLGESSVISPASIRELIEHFQGASIFIGNDSGPGHLAAIMGVPTFTIFGPAVPELYSPANPRSEWIPGAPCPYKPCYDSCRFPQPNCILETSEAQAWEKINGFVRKHCSPTSMPA